MKYYALILSMLMVSLLISCKDDDSVSKDEVIFEVYIPNSTDPVQHTFEDASTLKFVVKVLGSEIPDEDITVSFEVDESLLASFNATNETSYTLFPEANYTVDQTITISAGAAISDSISLVINGDQLEGSSYLLPITITEVTGAKMAESQTAIYFVLTKKQAVEMEDGKYVRTNWSIADFSTEEPAEGNGNGLAVTVLDGDWNTFWHTQWDGGFAPFPHEITIDMGQELTLHGIKYVNRPTDSRWEHGQPKELTVLTSTDGVNFTDAESFTELPLNWPEEEIDLPFTTEVNAQYFRISITAVWNDGEDKQFSNMAEVYAY